MKKLKVKWPSSVVLHLSKHSVNMWAHCIWLFLFWGAVGWTLCSTQSQHPDCHQCIWPLTDDWGTLLYLMEAHADTGWTREPRTRLRLKANGNLAFPDKMSRLTSQESDDYDDDAKASSGEPVSIRRHNKCGAARKTVHPSKMNAKLSAGWVR